jgi:uncharacterized protein YjbJ (UPF0337 family)
MRLSHVEIIFSVSVSATRATCRVLAGTPFAKIHHRKNQLSRSKWSGQFTWTKSPISGACQMPGKLEELKGKVEESVGQATGNEKLERKGQIDQVAGQAKQVVTENKREEIKAINQATREAKRNL